MIETQVPFNIANLDHFQLGECKESIKLSLIEENRILSQHMACQARKQLLLLSRDLDKKIYDNHEFINALSKLARLSKFSEILILVQDSLPAIKYNHQLIDLYRRLTSYIQIRKIHDDYSDYNEAFMLVDQRGLIFRQFADRYEATANYNDALLSQKLAKLFKEIWEKSSEDPQLRSLYI